MKTTKSSSLQMHSLHTKRMRELDECSFGVEGYGVANRAPAAVINGVQIDVGRVSEHDRIKVIDPRKI